jgi:hypothetical protein
MAVDGTCRKIQFISNSAWCMVYGVRCTVYGVWCTVNSVQYMVYGIYCTKEQCNLAYPGDPKDHASGSAEELYSGEASVPLY